jgi:hypothetical protein
MGRQIFLPHTVAAADLKRLADLLYKGGTMNIYELVTSLHDGAGNFFQNVFHYRNPEGISADSPYSHAAAVADGFISDVESDYMQVFGSDIVLDFISCKRITSGGGPSATRIRGTLGGGFAVSVNAGSAADVAWQTAGASHRPGHTFLPGLPDGSFLSGKLQGVEVAAIDTFATTFESGFVMAGAEGSAEPVIFSRKLAVGDDILAHDIRAKITYLNKRSLPIV